MRWNDACSVLAKVVTDSVLARPGTPSINTWLLHSSARSRPSINPSWPTITRASSCRTAAKTGASASTLRPISLTSADCEERSGVASRTTESTPSIGTNLAIRASYGAVSERADSPDCDTTSAK